MISLALLLVLTKTPPPMLEPKVAAGFNRLQAREMTSSSFLRDNFNRFDQNYLPIYAADDEASTAWVEGVPGLGVGEWLVFQGPRLAKAQAFQIFLRNGLQASKRLFEANARLKQIRLEPLVEDEAGKLVAAGKPVELELQSVEGWQAVELPVEGAVSAVRLTILSAYPGSKYEDTCLSDLRVYVKGGDAYRPELEAKVEGQIREQIASRKEASPKFASAYEGKKLVELPPLAEKGAMEGRLEGFDNPALHDPLTRVKAALESVNGAETRWRRVDAPKAEGEPNLSIIFSSIRRDENFVSPGALLNRNKLDLSKHNGKGREVCEVSAIGPLEHPTAVEVTLSVVEVEREDLDHPTYFQVENYVVVYAGDLADVVIDLRHDVAYALEWKPPVAGSGPVLADVISFELTPGAKRAAWKWSVKAS